MNVSRFVASFASAALLAAASAASAQTFSLESAVLDSRSSRNLGVTTERGELAALLRAQKAITFGILRASGISLDQLPADVRARIERFQTTNLDAFRAFSTGLDLRDQGRFAEAKEAFRRAAELDPGFALAREQQLAMPDVNVLGPVQLRAAIAATASAAVDRGKATYAVDLSRAMAAMQAGQTVVAVQQPPAEALQASAASAYTINSPGSGTDYAPNQTTGLAYRFQPGGGPMIGLASTYELTGGQYANANGVLESIETQDEQGNRFVAQRRGAAAVNLGSATIGDGSRVYWGQWLSSPGASAVVTVNQVPVVAPALGMVDFMYGEAPRQMPTSSTATFTPTGGMLQNPSGTISVNFATRDVTLNNLGFSIEGLAFSGLAGSARYSDKVASGVFTGNYTAGTCAGCAAFAPQSSAFGGNFVGRSAEGLLFSTFLFTGTGTVSGLQLFQRP